MTVTTARLAATVAAAAALGLVACGGSTTTPSGSATSAPASPTREAGASPGTVRKVSANTASEDEIAAALASAAVPNAKRWAKEVVEYRPYPANDPNLTKLRNGIAKYNPGPETTDKIVSALTP